MNYFRGGIISGFCLSNGAIHTNVLSPSLKAYDGPKLSGASVFENSFLAKLVVALNGFIRVVLRWVALPDISPSIVECIAIHMVKHLPWIIACHIDPSNAMEHIDDAIYVHRNAAFSIGSTAPRACLKPSDVHLSGNYAGCWIIGIKLVKSFLGWKNTSLSHTKT